MKIKKDEFKKRYLQVKQHLLKAKDAARILGVTPSYFCNFSKKYEKEGDRVFIHGRCGRKPSNAISDETRAKIVYIYTTDYKLLDSKVNFAYFRDELNETHRMKFSYSTVYKILMSAGIQSPEAHRKGRQPIHRQSFRREHFGELIQLDATPYQWFRYCGDGQYYTLHGAIDDATNKILALQMAENECSYGYLACRRLILQKYGVELEDYTDRSPIFSQNQKEKNDLSIDEQLGGVTKKVPLWQTINKELDIRLNLANSPQAKGKIERTWSTIQGRLSLKLKQAKLSAIDFDAVNKYLNEVFIPYYNTHFARTAKSTISAFKELPKSIDIDNLLCVKTPRLIHKDGTVSYKGLKIKVVGLKSYYSRDKIDFCVNEKSIFFLYKGTRYDAKIKDGELSDVPYVLERIISDALYTDVHEHAA